MGNAIQTLRTKCKFLKDGNMPLADVANKVIEFSKSHGLEFDSLDKATEFIKGILGQNTETVNFQGFQSVMNALKGKLQGK